MLTMLQVLLSYHGFGPGATPFLDFSVKSVSIWRAGDLDSLNLCEGESTSKSVHDCNIPCCRYLTSRGHEYPMERGLDGEPNRLEWYYHMLPNIQCNLRVVACASKLSL